MRPDENGDDCGVPLLPDTASDTASARDEPRTCRLASERAMSAGSTELASLSPEVERCEKEVMRLLGTPGTTASSMTWLSLDGADE